MTELLRGKAQARAFAALIWLGAGCSDSAQPADADAAMAGETSTSSTAGTVNDATAGTGADSAADAEGASGAPASAAGQQAGEDAAGSEEQTPITSPLTYAPCAVEARVGSFAVLSRPNADDPDSGSTQLTGMVRDGVRPTDLEQVLMEEGDCKLITGPNLLCDPRCGVGEVCSSAGVCIPEPESQDVGTVTIAGTSSELRLAPNTANFYLVESGTSVNYMPYEPGAALTLSASGATLEAFQLAGRGVDVLRLEAGEWQVAMDQPLPLRWQAPAEPDEAVRVAIELDIAHHGGVDAQVVCDVADTGSFDVPATLISGLLERGVAGFPAVTLTRRSVDSTTVGGGCVEFVVASEASREVTIPGLVSCGSDEECEEGQTCLLENLTCSD